MNPYSLPWSEVEPHLDVRFALGKWVALAWAADLAVDPYYGQWGCMLAFGEGVTKAEATEACRRVWERRAADLPVPSRRIPGARDERGSDGKSHSHSVLLRLWRRLTS